MVKDKISISVQDISFSYYIKRGFLNNKRHMALKGVSFDLHEGESLGIIGRNGAGKSTLIMLLAAILKPDTGKISFFAGEPAMLSLNTGFNPGLTGRQNAILSGIIRGVKRKTMLEKLDDIQNLAEIGEFFDRPIRMYSSGMRARLGFAVTMSCKPDIWLLDEVMGVGDKEFKVRSSTLLKEEIRSEKSVVLISHNMTTVEEFCQRVIWLDKGNLCAIGTPDEVIPLYEKNTKK